MGGQVEKGGGLWELPPEPCTGVEALQKDVSDDILGSCFPQGDCGARAGFSLAETYEMPSV